MKVTLGRYKDKGKRVEKVKINEWDTWNLDHTLALIIHPALVKFKKNLHGHPSDLTEQEWNDILDKMIFSFKAIAKDKWEEQFYSGEIDDVLVPVDAKGNEVPKKDAEYFLMKRGPNDTFQVDMKGKEAYQERINEGLMLFGKWYRALWD